MKIWCMSQRGPNTGVLVTSLLDRLVAVFAVDPFAYLVVTIFGIGVWTWCTMVGSLALTGRGLWIRRVALLVAGAGAVLFAYTVPGLR
jgi:hypothetical protein